jgi:hypothetical protein
MIRHWQRSTGMAFGYFIIFFLLFFFSLAELKNEQQLGSTMLPQAKRRLKARPRKSCK